MAPLVTHNFEIVAEESFVWYAAVKLRLENFFRGPLPEVHSEDRIIENFRLGASSFSGPRIESVGQCSWRKPYPPSDRGAFL
jgi:hypothetical protein